MERFAGYGFNKSHAAAYALIGTYQNRLPEAAFTRWHSSQFHEPGILGNTDKGAWRQAFLPWKRGGSRFPVPGAGREHVDGRFLIVRDGRGRLRRLGRAERRGLEAMRHVEALPRRGWARLFEASMTLPSGIDPRHLTRRRFEVGWAESARSTRWTAKPRGQGVLRGAPILSAQMGPTSQAEKTGRRAGGLWFGEAEAQRCARALPTCKA